MIAARAFAGKHYAVYGLARSGLTTVEALLASGAKVTAWDENAEARAAFSPAPSGAGVGGRGSRAHASPDSPAPSPLRGSSPPLKGRGVEIADLATLDLSQFDALVLSPGVPLNSHPLAARARDSGVEIIGDIELFARARPELPPHKVVGITGTNGKSTTTALVHHILQTAGVPSAMGGNIGLPILALDPLTPNENGVGVYVLELSSYQIDLTKSLDCDVAVLLNITPDHLDRYESFEAYAASKARLFAMQSEKHKAVAPAVEWWGKKIHDVAGCGILDVSDDVFHAWQAEPGAISVLEQPHWPALQGPHNLSNVESAMSACFLLGLDGHKIRSGLKTFPGLPHRMERVREKDGVVFVNDSKATNPTATAPALAAFSAIRWICGGQAKSDDLDECAPHFGNVRSAYTIGDAAERFARLLKPHMPVANCETLENAVNRAAEDSHPGDTVLLSPACASFDQFRDFEARGDRFRELVGAL